MDSSVATHLMRIERTITSKARSEGHPGLDGYGATGERQTQKRRISTNGNEHQHVIQIQILRLTWCKSKRSVDDGRKE